MPRVLTAEEHQENAEAERDALAERLKAAERDVGLLEKSNEAKLVLWGQAEAERDALKHELSNESAASGQIIMERDDRIEELKVSIKQQAGATAEILRCQLKNEIRVTEERDALKAEVERLRERLRVLPVHCRQMLEIEGWTAGAIVEDVEHACEDALHPE